MKCTSRVRRCTELGVPRPAPGPGVGFWCFWNPGCWQCPCPYSHDEPAEGLQLQQDKWGKRGPSLGLVTGLHRTRGHYRRRRVRAPENSVHSQPLGLLISATSLGSKIRNGQREPVLNPKQALQSSGLPEFWLSDATCRYIEAGGPWHSQTTARQWRVSALITQPPAWFAGVHNRGVGGVPCFRILYALGRPDRPRSSELTILWLLQGKEGDEYLVTGAGVASSRLSWRALCRPFS